MARIPDVQSLGDRAVPRSTRGFTDVSLRGDGDGLVQAGRVLGGVAESMERQNRENLIRQRQVNAANAKLDMMQAQFDVSRQMQENPSLYREAPELYKNKFAEIYQRHKASFADDPEGSELFDLASREAFMRGEQTIFSERQKYYVDDIKADLIRTQDSIVQRITPNSSRAQVQEEFEAYQAKLNGYAPALGVDTAAQQSIVARRNFDDAYFETIAASDPERAYAEASQVAGASVVEAILFNETGGAPIKAHADNKGKAIGGINSDSFPKEHAEAVRILRDEGEPAARAYIANFYDTMMRERGVYELPPSVQDVVGDGIVNHGAAFQAKLIDAAKSGASRDELIAMRREEYRRLADSDRDKPRNQQVYAFNEAGWNKRLDRLAIGGVDRDAASAWVQKTKPIVQGKTKTLMENNIALIERGMPIQRDITQQEAAQVGISADVYEVYQLEKSAAEFSARAIMMPPQDVAREIEALKPFPDDPQFETKQKIFEKAQASYAKQLDALEKDYVGVMASRNPELANVRSGIALQEQKVQAAATAYAQTADGTQERDAALQNYEAEAASLAAAKNQYFTQIRNEQLARGIAEPKILSAAEADSLAFQINAMANAAGAGQVQNEAPLAQLRQIKAQYGDFYADAIKQAIPKIDSEFQTVVQLPETPAMQMIASDMAQMAALKKSGKLTDEALKARIPEGFTQDNLRNAMRGQVNEFLSSLESTNPALAIEMQNKIVNDLTNTALFRAQGGNVDAVIKNMGRALSDSYAFQSKSLVNMNGEQSRVATYRVPVSAFGGDSSKLSKITNAATRALSQIKPQDIEPVSSLIEQDVMAFGILPRTQASYADAIRSYGYWATSEKEDGLTLMLPSGRAARRADGSLFKMTWQQLADMPIPSFVSRDISVPLPLDGEPLSASYSLTPSAGGF